VNVLPSAAQQEDTVRAVQAGPLTGMIADVALLAALAGTVGLAGAGWVVGVGCGVISNAALARGLSRSGSVQLGPAVWVTIARATLAVGVAALVADSFDRPAPVAMLVALTLVALALDALDGWVARRTGTASALGARFDGEVDAFLIFVLSVYVARSAGAWVLAIGAARYAFLAAGWLLPWMREPLPPRDWRKVVAATQGITLAITAADVLPLAFTRGALVAALALLAESFGRDVWWLWSHRNATQDRLPAAADGTSRPTAAPHADPRRGRVRTGIAAVLTILAVLLAWVALVAPSQPGRLTPGAFVRLPLEGLVIVALAVVLPATARRLLASVVGLALGLLMLVKILDIGFLATFDRPFSPVDDWSYTRIGIETLRDSIGRTDANLAVVGAAVLGVGMLVFTTLAVVRLSRVAAGHRRRSLQAVAALGAVWVLFWMFGAQLVAGTPIASTSAASLAFQEVRAVRAGFEGQAAFTAGIARDRFADTPGSRLLTGLRGKDVLLVFVESYGKVAVQDSSFSPQVDAALRAGTTKLQAAGFSAKSAFLTSPTFGGISWLAHSTMQSGVWIDSPRRYDELVSSNRFTLSEAFKRAGWRAIDDVPSNNRYWPQGSSFYHYDEVYDRREVGYRGPTYAYASMPDQYVLAALQRLELAKARRRPLFAEVDLVSSHEPWTRIPQLIDWKDVGNGSIFNRMPVDHVTRAALWSDAARVRAAYGRSIEYTMDTLVSFVQHYGDDKLVLVVLGDHQPATIVTGQGASHDVPISVIAHDPAVLKQIAGWDFENGLLPSPHAPVWPMNAFRDRFLSAFGSQPATR
jgi:phosphatidylglycerophosphate synthase